MTSGTPCSGMWASGCWTKSSRSEAGSDHNMQAVRVVTRLENRVTPRTHDGLNSQLGRRWKAFQATNGLLIDRGGGPYRRTSWCRGARGDLRPAPT